MTTAWFWWPWRKPCWSKTLRDVGRVIRDAFSLPSYTEATPWNVRNLLCMYHIQNPFYTYTKLMWFPQYAPVTHCICECLAYPCFIHPITISTFVSVAQISPSSMVFPDYLSPHFFWGLIVFEIHYKTTNVHYRENVNKWEKLKINHNITILTNHCYHFSRGVFIYFYFFLSFFLDQNIILKL